MTDPPETSGRLADRERARRRIRARRLTRALLFVCLATLQTHCSATPNPPKIDATSVRHDLALRRYEKAVDGSRKLLAETTQRRGAGSLEAAGALDLLSESLQGARGVHDAEALECSVRALRIREALRPASRLQVADGLHHLGALRYRRGEYAIARPLLERALAIRDDSLGTRSRESAATLLYLASLESDTGNDRRALPMVERALAIQESGLPATAEQVALCLNVRGGISYRLGDYPGAVSSFERSLHLSERLGPGQEISIGRTLFNLGGVLLELGDVTRAEEVLERSLDLRRRIYGPSSALVGTTQFSLGAAREEAGDLEGARRSYEDAIRIGERSLPDDERLVYPLLGLARIDLAWGDTTGSIPRLNRALQIRQRAYGTRHPDLAEVLVPLAQAHASLGDTARARSLLYQAWALQAETLHPRNPAIAVTLEALAGYHQRTGAGELALEEALGAEEIGREHLRHVALGLPEHQALAYAGVRTSGMDRALSILSSGSATASRGRVYTTLIRSRALVLDEVAHRLRLAARSSDPHVAERIRVWNEARQRLAALAVSGSDTDESAPEHRASLDRVRREADEAERALVAADPRSTPSDASLERISRAIPPGAALVSYVRTRDEYSAFVLGPRDSMPEFIPLGSSDEIDSSVERWMVTIWKGIGRSSPGLERACRESGARLRSLVFDPIRPALRSARLVLVVPDGALHQVNFYALPAGSGYMVESGMLVHELACERDLLLDSREAPSGGRALIVGGPDFDGVPGTSGRTVARGSEAGRTGTAVRASWSGGSPCPELGSLRFHSLPGSLLEAREVARMWREHADVPATVLTGSNATEHAFKTAAAGMGLLHLATHAYYLGDCRSVRPSVRGLGSTTPARPHASSLLVRDRPLLLSGLALAGANRRSSSRPGGEDGMLTAEEIAGMDLSKTSWAVLSGCETGLGRTQRSEGVIGLRRAFRMAGARSLILSLWPVEDQAGRVWMRHLYEARWRGRMGTAESVREASLRVLRERRAQARDTHPWSWASFVATGDAN